VTRPEVTDLAPRTPTKVTKHDRRGWVVFGAAAIAEQRDTDWREAAHADWSEWE
jgi:hypothetical protein